MILPGPTAGRVPATRRYLASHPPKAIGRRDRHAAASHWSVEPGGTPRGRPKITRGPTVSRVNATIRCPLCAEVATVTLTRTRAHPDGQICPWVVTVFTCPNGHPAPADTDVRTALSANAAPEQRANATLAEPAPNGG